MMVPANVTAATLFYANSVSLELPFYAIVPIAIVGAVIVVRALFSWQQRRFSGALVRQLPDAIQMVTSAVQAGLPVNAAFQTIAEKMPQPTAGQFVIIVGEMDLGKSAEDALDGVHQRTGLAEYGMFAVTLAVQMKSGGRLSETLQTLGETVRQRVALAARAKAMAGEVIFSARALSVAPFLIGGLFYWINPRIVDLLFTDRTGRFLLTYAVCSVLTGIFVIYWMIRRETTI
jgi:tight adherence protein B